jgi:predicted acetyltransferase
MKTITYHKATTSDIYLLVDNRISFALELAPEQAEESVLKLKQQLTKYFTQAMVDGSCISFFAKCEDKIAGIGSVHLREMPGSFKNPSGKWGYVMNMYTVPSYRRKGICKTILNLLVAEGEKYGITAFELHATPEGELVYLQNGFTIYNEPTLRKFIMQ